MNSVMYAFSSGAGDVPSEQIDKVLPYLIDRHAYPPFYVGLRVKNAFNMVRGAKQAKLYPAKEQIAKLSKTAQALRMIEESKGDGHIGFLILPKLSIEEIRRDSREIEWLAGALSTAKTGGKRNVGREVAVREAYGLLTDFSNGKSPGCTRDGRWHEVANILYATGDDLFPTMRKLHKFLSSEEIVSDFNALDIFRVLTEKK